jgi:hypothetical protein
MRVVPLDEIARGTVAADGTCEVTIGPIRRQWWNVGNIGVQNTSTVNGPTATAYLGPSKSGQFMSSTYDGVNANLPCNVRLAQGARVTVVWEDADPGSQCTVTVFGTMEVPQ